MSAKTAVVMLGRFGDIINILPCVRDIALKEGGKCAVVVSAEFASVLEGCSYVEPVIVSAHFTDVQPAIIQARDMFETVLVGKTNEKNIGITTQCASFNEESWRQCGYLERWNDLPLVFDRRDRAREAKLVEEWRTEDGGRRTENRLALVNFSGKSAPFAHGEAIKRFFRPDLWQVLDLGNVKARRIYDLLGLMDVADMLVTGDTATLHLAAASGVPAVNLIGDKPTLWHGSKPRNNSHLTIRYSEWDRFETVAQILQQWRPRTWHVWSDYAMGEDAQRRHEMARQTWPTAWIPFPVPVSGRMVNDHDGDRALRTLPFIKDMVNETVRAAGPRDVIVLTNADTCLSNAECGVRSAEWKGSAYSFRRDFARLDSSKSVLEIAGAPQYAGADFFAFTVEWWATHERELPDLVLGAECWDWCLRVLMKKTGGQEFNDLCYHERHANVWEVPEHRHSLASQRHNLSLAAPFLAAHGVK